MKDRILTITVKEEIYRYVTQSLNSDVVKLERGSTLMYIIRPHLILEPDDWELEPIPDGFAQLNIELPVRSLTVEARSGKVYYCDTLFRDHLTKEGLVKVRSFMKKNYNDNFCTFMAGWVEHQYRVNEMAEKKRRIHVTDGITAFFNNYHIEFTEAMVEARRQAWKRYMDKVEKYDKSPILN